MHHWQRRPVGWLIRRKSAFDGIDTEGKKTVKFGMKALQPEHVFVEQITVDGFEVTHIKDDAVTFWDRTLVHRIRADDLKEFVTAPTGVQEAFEQFVRNSDIGRSGQ